MTHNYVCVWKTRLQFIMILLSMIYMTSPVFADQTDIPAKSKELNQSGMVRTGAQMPFFSGWLTNGQVLNLPQLLKKNKKRYVITMCASWCQLCFKGLEAISKSAQRFKKQDVELVVYVADSEKVAKKIHKDYQFDWANVLIDEFSTQARKFSVNPGKDKETLELPRTFILDSKGKVELIIGTEGLDYIDLLLGVKP